MKIPAQLKIAHEEFQRRVVAALTLDERLYPRLKIYDWLMDRFAFADDGCIFIGAGDNFAPPEQPGWPPMVVQ